MTDPSELIHRLYDGLNRRSAEAMRSVCHPEIEFSVPTGGLAGRAEPYRGHGGLDEYLADLERIWDELLVTPIVVEGEANDIHVRGRIYLRSRTLGIHDVPVTWRWAELEGLLHRGRVAQGAEAVSSPRARS